MASQGYEVTHAQSMNMNNSGRPRPPTASASSGRPRSASRSSGGKRSAGGSGGSKQTAKRRAKERAMTQEQRAARKKQSILGGITTALVVAGCAFCIWKFALNSPTTAEEWREGFGRAVNNTKDNIGRLGDVLDNLDGFDWGNFFADDPWAGNTTVTLWKEKYINRENGGLILTLVNNLDDKWQSEFEVAVADWSESDALTLTVKKGSFDKGCERSEGVMTVCNDNFGETGWVGINENEVEQGSNRIISSVAKMNEYYLRNANFYHRRFTMCHEIGHGFGLPHTDENPYNKNQGNCMDYTDDPEENLLPGEVNFVKLSEVYLAQPEVKEPVRRRLLRRVEKDNGNVIETVALVVNEDKFDAWGLAKDTYYRDVRM